MARLHVFDYRAFLGGDAVKLVNQVVDFCVGRGDFTLEPAAVREGRIDSVMRLTGSRSSTPLRFGDDTAARVHRW